MSRSLRSKARSKGMDSPADRLKKLRIKAGFESATDAARAMGVASPTYLGHENGSTGLRRAAAIRYAVFFGTTIDWLLTGKGKSGSASKVPVICYIGAGAEVHPIDDHPQGRGLEQVDPPQGVSDCVAAIIRGESMHPMRDGWLVFWSKTQQGVPEECLGKLCVVQVRDGPMLLKELYRGSRPGHYRLESWNAPPREDVQVEWAAKVTDIRQR
jgi:DNA-binding XRE family transcriptional regulator